MPAPALSRLAFYYEEPPARGFAHGVAQKRNEHEQSESRSAPVVSTTTREEVMSVMIGVDPHKATHTAVAIDGTEESSRA